MYEFSAETYFKFMQNQIDYKDNANEQTQIIETQLLYGKGRAYGLELLLKKNKGKFTGWVGYTLSRSEKLIDGINKNNWYPARQDRTHDISFVTMYDISKRWNISAVWVYQTGNAITFPSGKYEVAGQTTWLYTERNGYRMPAYHRLDLGATYKLKDSKKFSSELSFSVYNAYGRENPYIITFEQSKTDPNKTVAIQTSLFKWVPSISWNFKF
jgi:outer membrane receptor protein involved in Fe transport